MRLYVNAGDRASHSLSFTRYFAVKPLKELFFFTFILFSFMMTREGNPVVWHSSVLRLEVSEKLVCAHYGGVDAVSVMVYGLYLY